MNIEVPHKPLGPIMLAWLDRAWDRGPRAARHPMVRRPHPLLAQLRFTEQLRR